MGSEAAKRGIPFEIDADHIEQLMKAQNNCCALSGLPIELGWYRERTTASLDRIDSAKGYVPGNVQWLHKAVNIMKGAVDQRYFVALCDRIARHSFELIEG
jgi:hypothetical protein